VPDFLLEIGIEEIPAGYIRPALKYLKDSFIARLKDKRLEIETNNVETFATPRRLTLYCRNLPEESRAGYGSLIKGPPKEIAYDEHGNPTDAFKGFSKKIAQVDFDIKIEEFKFKNREYIGARAKFKAEPASKVLQDILPAVISAIAFPKSMYWNDPRFVFARPIRNICAVLGNELIPFEVNGVKSCAEVFAHPFLSPGKLSIVEADIEKYKNLLRNHFVYVDQGQRKKVIREKIERILKKHDAVFTEEDLLDEVTFLTEYPGVIEGSFDEKYLSLPAEVVEESMKEHQRYFPIVKSDGTLVPRFITVINRPDEKADSIREGNERVLNARLADARFFMKEDVKKSLESRVESLKGVVFIDKLGSYYEKIERMQKLVEPFGEMIGASAEEIKLAKRAAYLSKADLVTEMVGEFPALQGEMGYHYALHDGEKEDVARAIREQYLPRYVDDRAPQGNVSSLVALADKLDTLAGCFLIGLVPSGNQDPYALRRRAQGVIRIIRANSLKFSLGAALDECLKVLPSGDSRKAKEGVTSFISERLQRMVLDEGFNYDIVRSAMAAGFDDLTDFHLRLEALRELSSKEFWSDLVTVVERTYNIGKNLEVEGEVDESLLAEPEEKKLWEAYKKNRDRIARLISKRDYVAASEDFEKTFSKVVHRFFDKVFVNVEDERLRNNRQRMLKKINLLYSEKIADLSRIVEKEK